jgi:molybdate transport system ATP-binding protein
LNGEAKSSEANGAATLEARFAGRIGGFRLDAAFSVPARGITALVGPSGGGKTSLLRCIAGLARLPGRLSLGGEVWQDEGRFTPPHRRAIGYVFQEASLLAHLSVRRNLLYGFKRRRGRDKVGFDEVVALLGLGALLDRAPAQLSGGERQRAAIGRALLSQPELLLMDEPLSSLDAQSKAEVLPYLDQLHRTLPAPILYVSHDLAEVARLADRVLFMRAGRIVAPPAEPGHDPGLAPSLDDDARKLLDVLDQSQIERLAAAALLAGLDPAEW